MRETEFEAIRPHLEQAVGDIDYFLTGISELEQFNDELSELYDSMTANPASLDVERKPQRLTAEQYMALVYGTRLRGKKRPGEPLDERQGKSLSDEEREAILADLDRGQPLSDAGRKALEFSARGGWQRSSGQAAIWLREAGENVAASGIDAALNRLPERPLDVTTLKDYRKAMQTEAGYVRAILVVLLKTESGYPTYKSCDPENGQKEEGCLASDDDCAEQYRDNHKWCDRKYAKERYNLAANQLTKAHKQPCGLHGVRIEPPKNVKPEKGRCFEVFLRTDLKMLADAIDRQSDHTEQSE